MCNLGKGEYGKEVRENVVTRQHEKRAMMGYGEKEQEQYRADE